MTFDTVIKISFDSERYKQKFGMNPAQSIAIMKKILNEMIHNLDESEECMKMEIIENKRR